MKLPPRPLLYSIAALAIGYLIYDVASPPTHEERMADLHADILHSAKTAQLINHQAELAADIAAYPEVQAWLTTDAPSREDAALLEQTLTEAEAAQAERLAILALQDAGDAEAAQDRLSALWVQGKTIILASNDSGSKADAFAVLALRPADFSSLYNILQAYWEVDDYDAARALSRRAWHLHGVLLPDWGPSTAKAADIEAFYRLDEGDANGAAEILLPLMRQRLQGFGLNPMVQDHDLPSHGRALATLTQALMQSNQPEVIAELQALYHQKAKAIMAPLLVPQPNTLPEVQQAAAYEAAVTYGSLAHGAWLAGWDDLADTLLAERAPYAAPTPDVTPPAADMLAQWRHNEG